DAFASWIPGGTVESYSWKDGAAVSDDHSFIKLVPYAGGQGPGKWCVTVKGSQTTDTGGRVHVERRSCIPLSEIYGVLSKALDPGRDFTAVERDRHPIVITGPGPDPVPDAYIDPWGAGLVSPGTRTNLLVHFAGDPTRAVEYTVAEALAHSGLENAAV